MAHGVGNQQRQREGGDHHEAVSQETITHRQ
jgi:hypothetical protein